MMMRFTYILIALLIGTSSCNDFLDTKPTDFVTPSYKTVNDFELALAGVYDILGNRTFYGDVWPYWLNVSTDIEYTNTGSANATVYIYGPAEANVTDFWKALYTGVYRANLILDVVDGTDLDDGSKNRIKGQALFLRAYYYFMLVSNYGDIPLYLSAKPSINEMDVPRTPMKEVYNLVVTDMLEAEQLVDEVEGGTTEKTVNFGGRISRSAVQGVLARVYLKMAGYPLMDQSKYADALRWALAVKNSGLHSLNPDYTDVFIKYAKDEYDIRESIWEVEFYGNTQGAMQEYTYYIGARGGIRTQDAELGRSGGLINGSGKLFDLYELDPNSTAVPLKDSYDLRRDWNLAPYTYVGTPGVKTPNNDRWRRNMGKWRREYEVVSPKDISTSPQNFPILRYADILLMAAEAENELNGPVNAYPYINEVRRRAYGLLLPQPPNPNVNADLSGLSKDEFRQAIRDERAREFCFEASRRTDLIRWGNFVGDMKAYITWALANGGVEGHVLGSRNVSDRNVLLPIPTYDMSLNKALTQNPGY
ncbi:RagB/SusD family nutrient uptake outer membrane protein [Sphingobacterium haloxyli]|uniref:RagB/SusD family nutrient uptake outer membrane protein n=1 Tax=Sphingobacterium haloxyli TaxID=2100533 RepID=A0A2S9IZV1_9SPHI|nr:RagB/SusD family nutrient uptake outer membrane protein [Sphingobacterium haloxyli]PRD46062.1 RagB/SusD family nutrient uptake outer membrane protein [Sphingobacterium haloxyli]